MDFLPTATHFSRRNLRMATPAILLFTACASIAPIPFASLYAAQQAILVAGREGARTYAPAEIAVELAEGARSDRALAAHRVSVADRRIDAARAQAEARVAEEQRLTRGAQVEVTPLDSHRREAVPAEPSSISAYAPVLPLVRILFDDGGSELEPPVTGNLDRVSDFLADYPSRTASLEGFTDNRGGEDYNQALSQRRADSVKRYLVGRGVPSERLGSTGRGENAPVADNESVAGRRQNRRVEITLNQASGASGVDE